jgi:spore coat protein U-like protein
LEAVIDFGEDERLEEEVTETGTVTYTCAGTATLDQHRTLPAEGRIRC